MCCAVQALCRLTGVPTCAGALRCAVFGPQQLVIVGIITCRMLLWLSGVSCYCVVTHLLFVVVLACSGGVGWLVPVWAVCCHPRVGGGVGPASDSLPVKLAAADHHWGSGGVQRIL